MKLAAMATSIIHALAFVLVVLPSSVEGAFLRAKGGRSNGCTEPEGSVIVEGPDCGSMEDVLPMYQNAVDVGSLAGKASGAVVQVTSAAEAVERAKARAQEIAAAVGEDGELPQPIKLASDAADEAVTAATSVSSELETSLSAFKAKASGSEMSGADVAAADKVDLAKLTDEASVAAKDAYEAAERILKKADEWEEKAMSDTATAAKLIQGFVDKAGSTLEEIADVVQKSKDAVKDADRFVRTAETQAAKIARKAADAGDQAPVWEALKGSLEGTKTGVTEQQAAVTAEIETVNTAATTLKEKVDPLKQEAATAAGGAAVQDQTAALAAAEGSLDAAAMALSKIKEKVKILVGRQSDLESSIDEAEKKLA